MLTEVVELMDGQLAERSLPSPLGVVLVDDRGVTPHGVHVSTQSPGPVDQRVDGISLGRLWGGAVRKLMGRHLVLRYRRGTVGSWGWTEHDCCTGRGRP